MAQMCVTEGTNKSLGSLPPVINYFPGSITVIVVVGGGEGPKTPQVAVH